MSLLIRNASIIKNDQKTQLVDIYIVDKKIAEIAENIKKLQIM